MKENNMKDIKTCTRCSVEKPVTREYFPTREKGELRADCRDCYNKSRRDSSKYAKTSMLSECKRRAKLKNRDFNLCKDTLEFPKFCPILNIELKHGQENWFNSPNIDRIDNNKGYTMDNVIIVSALANTIKTSANPAQIIKVGKFYKKLYVEKGINYDN